MSPSIASAPLYDLIGLGFGPANIAIAGAILDKQASPDSAHASVSATSFPSHTSARSQNLRSAICYSMLR